MNGHFRKMVFIQILNTGQRLLTRWLGKIQKREVESSAFRELSFDDAIWRRVPSQFPVRILDNDSHYVHEHGSFFGINSWR